MLVTLIMFVQGRQQVNLCLGLHEKRSLALDNFDGHLLLRLCIHRLDYLAERALAYSSL
jgi:hypothetical protein